MRHDDSLAVEPDGSRAVPFHFFAPARALANLNGPTLERA